MVVADTYKSNVSFSDIDIRLLLLLPNVFDQPNVTSVLWNDLNFKDSHCLLLSSTEPQDWTGLKEIDSEAEALV